MSLSKLELKDDPTNEDLQQQNFELHTCMEELARRIDRDRHDSKSRDQALDGQIGRLQGSLDTLLRFLGAPQSRAQRLGTPEYRRPAQRKTLAGWERRAAIATVVGAVLGTMSAFPLIAAVFRAVVSALLASR